MSGLRYAVDDKKTDAVAHLAVARTQNTGPAFWGTTKDKSGSLGRPLFSNVQTSWCSAYRLTAESKNHADHRYLLSLKGDRDEEDK